MFHDRLHDFQPLAGFARVIVQNEWGRINKSRPAGRSDQARLRKQLDSHLYSIPHGLVVGRLRNSSRFNDCRVGLVISCCYCALCPKCDSFAAGFVAQYPNEDERLDGETVVFCPLPHVRGRIRGALFITFGRPAHRTAHRPEAFRG
jgi:hypothetical protein